MNELLEKVDIEDGFYIYLQRNSKVWLARFKIDGKWISRTTKQRDKTKAIIAANKVKTECDVLHAHGVSIQTKAFNVVAELAIKRMQEALPGAKGQGSFKDYERFLYKYHIPYFDRTHISNIDRVKLMAFDDWRVQKAGRRLTQSTIKSHNAALQRVFDEAVLHKWMQGAATCRSPSCNDCFGAPQSPQSVCGRYSCAAEADIPQAHTNG